MDTRITWALLITLGACCSVGCSPPEPAAAPKQSLAERNRRIERDQRELEQRRLQLEKQVLADLRKLRGGRQASTDGAQAPEEEKPASKNDCEMLVFGGAIHEVFLGCLVDERRPDSVFNMIGEYGSDLSDTSIRNKFAPYGSNHDDTSACNAAAKRPPLVVTSDGKSLGLLSVNRSLDRRITSKSVNDWLARMCGE